MPRIVLARNCIPAGLGAFCPAWQPAGCRSAEEALSCHLHFHFSAPFRNETDTGWPVQGPSHSLEIEAGAVFNNPALRSASRGTEASSGTRRQGGMGLHGRGEEQAMPNLPSKAPLPIFSKHPNPPKKRIFSYWGVGGCPPSRGRVKRQQPSQFRQGCCRSGLSNFPLCRHCPCLGGGRLLRPTEDKIGKIPSSFQGSSWRNIG